MEQRQNSALATQNSESVISIAKLGRHLGAEITGVDLPLRRVIHRATVRGSPPV